MLLMCQQFNILQYYHVIYDINNIHYNIFDISLCFPAFAEEVSLLLMSQQGPTTIFVGIDLR